MQVLSIVPVRKLIAMVLAMAAGILSAYPTKHMSIWNGSEVNVKQAPIVKHMAVTLRDELAAATWVATACSDCVPTGVTATCITKHHHSPVSLRIEIKIRQ